MAGVAAWGEKKENVSKSVNENERFLGEGLMASLYKAGNPGQDMRTALRSIVGSKLRTKFSMDAVLERMTMIGL